MTTTSGISGIAGSQATPTTTAPKQLGQQDFLKLMTTQLKNQDPSSPQDPTQMFSQMAQFSQVTSLNNLQSSFDKLSKALVGTQSLSATNVIGRYAEIDGTTATLDSSLGLRGKVNVPFTMNNVQVTISDAENNIVSQQYLGVSNAGTADFKWDGKLADGTLAPAGTYNVSAKGLQGNTVTDLTIKGGQKVAGVSISSDNTVQLKLNNDQVVSLNSVDSYY